MRQNILPFKRNKKLRRRSDRVVRIALALLAAAVTGSSSLLIAELLEAGIAGWVVDLLSPVILEYTPKLLEWTLNKG